MKSTFYEYGGHEGGVRDWGGPSQRIAELRAPTDAFSTIFGRTELIIGASRAKNCEEVDGEVHFSIDPPKPAQKGVKRFLRPKNLTQKFFFGRKLN